MNVAVERRNFMKVMAAASGVALASSCRPRADSTNPQGHRVLVVAFDGLDPEIVKSLMDAGRMPHLARLAAAGSFTRIGTSTPPHTPVAFSNIISGADPGLHQVFDFIHRDPRPAGTSSAMRPYFSTAEASSPESQWTIPLGQWQLPLTGGETKLLRRGPAFWDYLVREGIDADVYYLPANYPPSQPEGPGRLRTISGMGTPDLLGSYGEFTFFTPHAPLRGRNVDGGRFAHLSMFGNHGTAELLGPADFLRRPDQSGVDALRVSLDIARDPTARVARIAVSGQVVLLNEGEWSDWIPVEFHTGMPGSTVLGAVGAPASLGGMVRLFLKQVHPKLELYVSPINIDPLAAANQISAPTDFASRLAHRHGRFYTAGIPEDTKALSHGVLSEDQFLDQSELVMEERGRQYRSALDDFRSGCLFFYFGATDLLQHMFWRDQDPQHPGRVPEQAGRYEKVIEDTYIRIDQLVGDARKAIGPEDTLIVMSDHGFTSFRRGFNLNSWLYENGFIKLINPRRQGRDLLFGNVDWSGTRAYGLGMNGLYVNRKGRERHGTVSASSQSSVLDQIREKLMNVRDTDGTPVIASAGLVGEMYPGADQGIAPDLIVGYGEGYRASWATVLGQMPRTLIEDNLDRWSGTHLTSADVVPGVLVSNRELAAVDPTVSDIAPTILAEFGIGKPSHMTGRALFAGSRSRQ